MNLIIIGAVSFAAGIMASMGLGGGMVLILYLAFFTSSSQLEAQGINLIFFIPVSVVALILHAKRKLVSKKHILLPIISGSVSVTLSSYLANKFNSVYLQKAFAVFIIISALFQMFKKQEN